MATAKRSQAQLLLIEESVWGTTPGTPSAYKIPISGISGDWYRRNLIPVNEIRGTRNPAPPVLGNIAVTGSFMATGHLDSLGWVTKHAVGVPDTTGSDPYTHVSKVNFSGSTEGGDLPAGLTLEVGFTDEDLYFPYTGCKVASLNIAATSEGVLEVTVNIVGKNLTTPAVTSLDASPTEYTSLIVDHSDLAILEGGASIATVTDVQLTLDNGLDTSQYVIGGAGALGALPEGEAVVSGQLTALFDSLTLFNKALNSTESSLTLTWTQGTSSWELEVPELIFEPRAPQITGDAGVKVTLPFRGYYADDADSTVLKSTLVNSVTSY